MGCPPRTAVAARPAGIHCRFAELPQNNTVRLSNFLPCLQARAGGLAHGGNQTLILLSILKVLNRRDWTERRDKQIVFNSLPLRSAERWVLVAPFDFTAHSPGGNTYPNSLICKFLGLAWPWPQLGARTQPVSHSGPIFGWTRPIRGAPGCPESDSSATGWARTVHRLLLPRQATAFWLATKRNSVPHLPSLGK